MSTDPLDERSAQLFAAARKESPSDETRCRILAALRAEPRPALPFKAARFSGSRVWVPAVLAAAALCVLVLVFRNEGPETFDISPEPFSIETARRGSADAAVSEEARPEKATPALPPSRVKKQTTPLPASPQKVLKPRPPSLEEELAGMQRARAALDRGDGAAALSELSGFDRGKGFRKLTVEANLLRIEALAQAGRTDEARAEARLFVEKNPNNPLVDRAQNFTHPPASTDTDDSVKSEPVKSESD